MHNIRFYQKAITIVLIFLYSCGIISIVSVNLMHDFFHHMEESVHLHDHSHDHAHPHQEQDIDRQHNNYKNRQDIHTSLFSEHHQKNFSGNTHGHQHNKVIDTILKSIDREAKPTESHHIFVLEYYFHINSYYSIEQKNIPGPDKKQYSNIATISSLFYPSPPEPPPKVVSTSQGNLTV